MDERVLEDARLKKKENTIKKKKLDGRVLEDARRVPHARVREDGEEGDRGREEGPALQQLRHAVRVGAVGEAPPRHVPEVR